MNTSKLHLLALYDGTAGTKAGLDALTQYLKDKIDLDITFMICSGKFPWQLFYRLLTIYFFRIIFLKKIAKHYDLIPDLCISCGRKSIIYSLAIKYNYPKVRNVHIFDPAIARDKFDLIIAPHHDQVKGKNVFTVLGSLSKIRKQTLQKVKNNNIELYKSLKKPINLLLIGGKNKAFDLDMNKIFQAIEVLAKEGTLLISCSRRTGNKLPAIVDFCANFSNIKLYVPTQANKEPNPYQTYLSMCDNIIITEDSINMISEAISTGKPCFLLPLKEINIRRSKKFHLFSNKAIKLGLINKFSKYPVKNTAHYINPLPHVIDKIMKDILDK